MHFSEGSIVEKASKHRDWCAILTVRRIARHSTLDSVDDSGEHLPDHAALYFAVRLAKNVRSILPDPDNTMPLIDL